MLLVSTPASAVRFVVAIGNDLGLPVEEPLRWAEADAQRVAEVMVDLGGVTSSRAILLRGRPPAEIEQTLLIVRGQIDEARRRGDRTELIVSYSGHGDATRLHLAGEVMAIQQLLALLDAAAADATVVILDACRGGVRAGRGRGATRGPSFDVRLVDELAPRGRVVMSSASDGEVAQESDDLEGAFFTHHVLAGLRGAADVDADGTVVLNELFAYAHARTLSGSFGGAPAVQHPELRTSLRGQGDLALTRLDRSQAVLELSAAVDGRFLIADARSGRVILEVEKPAGSALRLAVPARRLRVLSRRGFDTSVAEVDVGRGVVTVVGVDDFVKAPRLVGRARGGDVDKTPFGLLVGFQLTSPVTLPLLPVRDGAPWAGPATGIVVAGELRLFDSPWFVGLQLGVAHAGGDVSGGSDVTGVDDVVFEEFSARAVVPLMIERWTPVGRLSGGLGLGLQGVQQTRRRTDADRLAAAGIDLPVVTWSTGLAPLAAARGSWWVPVTGGVAVVVTADVGAAAHVLDGRWQAAAHLGLGVAMGAEL